MAEGQQSGGGMNRFFYQQGNNNGMLFAVVLSLLLYVLDFSMTRFDGLNIPRIYSQVFLLGKVLQGIVAFGLFIALVYYLLHRGEKDARSFYMYLFFGIMVSFIIAVGGLNIGVVMHIMFPYFIIKFARPDLDLKQMTVYLSIGYFIDFFLFGIISMYLNNPLLGNRLIIPIWVLYTLYEANLQAETPLTRTVTTIILISILLIYTTTFLDGMRIMNETKLLGSDQVRSWRQFVSDGVSSLRDIGSQMVDSVKKFKLFDPCAIAGDCPENDTSEVIPIREQGVTAKFDDSKTTKYEEGRRILERLDLDITAGKEPVEVNVRCFIKPLRMTEEDEARFPIEGTISGGNTFSTATTIHPSPRCEFPASDGLEARRYLLYFNVTYDFVEESTRSLFLMDSDTLEAELKDRTEEYYLRSKGLYVSAEDPASGPVAVTIGSRIPTIIGVTRQEEGDIPFKVTLTDIDTGSFYFNKLDFIYPQDMNLGNCDFSASSGGAKDAFNIMTITRSDIDDPYMLKGIKDTESFYCNLYIPYSALSGIGITQKSISAEFTYTYSLTKTKDVIVVPIENG